MTAGYLTKTRTATAMNDQLTVPAGLWCGSSVRKRGRDGIDGSCGGGPTRAVRGVRDIDSYDDNSNYSYSLVSSALPVAGSLVSILIS